MVVVFVGMMTIGGVSFIEIEGLVLEVEDFVLEVEDLIFGVLIFVSLVFGVAV